MSIDWDALVIGKVVATFGDPVTYVSATGGTLTGITGVFDAEYLDQGPIGSSSLEQMGMPSNITGYRPVLGVQLSQFTTPPAQGDQLTVITGMTYMVMEVRADGHGWAKLLLNEAQ